MYELVFGISGRLFGILSRNPQVFKDWTNWIIGLKVMRKIRGESVSP